MKVIYNNKEVGDNRNNYNRLTDKPLINSVELVGNITLNDINVYSKEEVKRLISSTRSVKVALVLPSPLTPNTTYYIGPDMNGIYTVYLTDNSDPINAFVIGTTSFGKYYSGEGINVTDPSNIVSVLVDSESVIINSEGNLEAITIFDKVEPFRGASIARNGTKGIVPTPNAGDQDKFLKGDGTWTDGGAGGDTSVLIRKFHPVGSIYISYSSSYNPNTLFPGTTWVQLSENTTLQTDSEGTLGTLTDSEAVIPAGMPNIKGDMSKFGNYGVEVFAHNKLDPSTVINDNCPIFYTKKRNDKWTISTTSSTSVSNIISESQVIPTIDTYYTDKGDGYGYNLKTVSAYSSKDSTVKPASISVCIWRRTA